MTDTLTAPAKDAALPAGVATGPLLTSYFLKPGIFLASGTCLSK